MYLFIEISLIAVGLLISYRLLQIVKILRMINHTLKEED